ncbi:hypothetical protein Ahy_B01g055762 [Arachis hypogaea]|uniref:Uncharacterized protein n=1 Tax=Arachis hypogaea TaxID=3818 RepID=A0A445AX03_ARAHY|nr:hypothetical protein Ahy_B01g055762 [Arachis hypogaea]
MFSANRQLSMHLKDLIQQNDQAGIRPSKTYQALANVAGGPANLTFIEKDVRNYISQYDLHNSRWLNGSIIFRFIAASVWLLYRCYFIVNMGVALKDIFADRHMLVLVFFKDEFWAGMRSTQHSESMHSVFDKYLNSKSSLLQFVRQYQNCVIDKEQKEFECDAADLRGIIPCVSSSPIKK